MFIEYVRIKMNKKKVLLSIVIALILVTFLLIQIDIIDLFNVLSSIPPSFIVLGFILYVLSYFFRALRFRILLDGEISIRDLFSIVCVHNMVNNILPARTGELSYVYLTRKLHNKKTGEVITTLLVARVFDFITVSLLFFISAFMIQNLPAIIMKAIWIIAVFLVLVVFMLISLIYFGEEFIYLVKRIVARFERNNRMINYAMRKGEEIVEFSGGLTKVVILRSFFVSFGMWITSYMVALVLITGMRLNLNIFEILICTSFLVFTTILPIQGILGLGSTEGAWSIAFLIFGISKEVAISASFGLHIISLCYLLILGFYGIKKLELGLNNHRVKV